MYRLDAISAYFCMNYPHKSELSKTRLTKLVYLCDWKFTQRYGKQATNIKWYFDHYGPYVEDVVRDVESHPDIFKVTSTINMYGKEKKLIEINQTNTPYISDYLSKALDEKITSILSEVITETSPLHWDTFIAHVYSTDPIMNSDKYERLNLVKFASKHKS